MKQAINFLLSALAPFASVPTGWAIYAGVTETPVFPMHPVAAGVGAVAIIATSIAAGLLVTDIVAYNQGMRNKAERDELSMSALPAWGILAGCVLAEIALSLLIVVIPGALPFGVLVFPLMTAAGVFAFAVRHDLQARAGERDALRQAAQADKEKRQAERKAERQARKADRQLAQVAPTVAETLPQVARKPLADEELLAYLASNPGESHAQVAAHFGVSRQAIGQRVKKLYEVKQ